MTTDIELLDQGTLVTFRPLTEAGRAWMDENVQAEPWQRLGDAVCVDHRLAGDLATGMADDGLILA